MTVNLVNPFTAGLDITKITSSVTSHGIALGTIATSTNFTSVGKSTTTSPTLDLNLNFDPAALFTLTRVLAVEAGESITQLDGIVQLGGYQYVASTNADAPPSKREAEPRDLSKRNIYTCVYISQAETVFSNYFAEGSISRPLLTRPSSNSVPMSNLPQRSPLVNIRQR